MASRKDKHGIVLRTGEYERPNNKGYQFVYKDASGKRQTISAPNLDDLREREKEVQINILAEIRSPRTMTINDAYARWLQLKRGLKENTKSNYMYMYTHFVARDFGKRKLKSLKRSDVRAFYNSLVDDGMQVNSLDTIHNVLHQVLDVAVEDEYIRYNPSDKAMTELKRLHRPKKRKALTAEEQKRFIDFLSHSEEFGHWFPVFYSLLATGMRVGEITGLRWEDIDFKKSEIHITHTLAYYKDETLHKQMFRINTTKTQAGFRTIPLPKAMKVALLDLLMAKNRDNITCVSNIDGYTDFVFLNRFGEVHHQGTLNRALRERIIPTANAEAARLGLTILPPFSCHNLRHTYCVNLCEANVDIKTIQRLMGHNDTRTTMDIYAEATKGMKERATITIDQYLDTLLVPSDNEAEKKKQ